MATGDGWQMGGSPAGSAKVRKAAPSIPEAGALRHAPLDMCTAGHMHCGTCAMAVADTCTARHMRHTGHMLNTCCPVSQLPVVVIRHGGLQ